MVNFGALLSGRKVKRNVITIYMASRIKLAERHYGLLHGKSEVDLQCISRREAVI